MIKQVRLFFCVLFSLSMILTAWDGKQQTNASTEVVVIDKNSEKSASLDKTPSLTVNPSPLQGAGKQTISIEVINEPVEIKENKPLKVVLFVQNNAVQKEYQQYMAMTADLLGAALNDTGILTINPENVIEENPTSSKSALTRMLGADYFITATLRRVTSKKTGLNPETTFTTLSMGMTLNVARASDAAAFASQNLLFDTPPQTPLMMQNNLEDIFHNLLEVTVSQGTEWLTEKIAAKEFPTDDAKTVTVGFSCNVPGAYLEIDGVTVGTINESLNLKIAQGLHKVKVSQLFFVPFEATAIFQEGSKFDIMLELTDEGMQRWESEELFLNVQKRLMDSGATKDYTDRVLSEANAEFLKNSHFHWDGALQNLVITPENQLPIIYSPLDAVQQQ